MIFQGFTPVIGAVSLLFLQVLAQDTETITDPDTGFKFPGAQVVKYDPPLSNGAVSLGVAFPKGLDKDEYIGYMVAARPKAGGWTGISHTSGMSKSLLLVTWPEGKDVITSFRYAKAYDPPVPYTGTGTTLTQLSRSVNATHYSLTYRCQKCTNWDQGGNKGNQSMKGDVFLFGWAQGGAAPSTPKTATSAISFHDLGFGVLPIEPKIAANVDYDTMAAMAPKGTANSGAAAAVPVPAPAKGTASAPAKGTTSAPAKGTAPAPAKGTASTPPKGNAPGKTPGKGPAVPQQKGKPKLGGPEMRFRK